MALEKPGRGSWAYQPKNSSKAMLYTRLVIGDETESSTRPFIRRHSFVFSTTVNSFILNPLMGNIGSHADLTSGRRDRQVKGARIAERFLSKHSFIALPEVIGTQDRI